MTQINKTPDATDNFAAGCVWIFALLPYGFVLLVLIQGGSLPELVLFIVFGSPLFLILPLMVSDCSKSPDSKHHDINNEDTRDEPHSSN